MIKIKHKELAMLLGTTAGYSRKLLCLKKLKISNKYLVEVIDLIMEHRKSHRAKI